MPRNSGAAASSDNDVEMVDADDYDYDDYGDDGEESDDDENYYDDFWKLLTMAVLISDNGFDATYVENMPSEELQHYIDEGIKHTHKEIRRRFGKQALKSALEELDSDSMCFAYYGMVQSIVPAATVVMAKMEEIYNQPTLAVGTPIYQGHPGQVQGHPVQVQGHPVQVQGHPVQGHPVQGHPVQGDPVQGHPTGQGIRGKRHNKSRRYNKSRHHNKSRHTIKPIQRTKKQIKTK